METKQYRLWYSRHRRREQRIRRIMGWVQVGLWVLAAAALIWVMYLQGRLAP